MKEEDKYYTPTIEEFHVGFEYEEFVKHEGWLKTKLESLGNHGINKNGFCLDYDDYRVKYLDKEDIESLGWKLAKVGDAFYHGTLIFELKKAGFGFNEGTDYTLINYPSERYVHIKYQTYSSYQTYEGEFKFKIKNKSELKKLMQQLSIV